MKSIPALCLTLVTALGSYLPAAHAEGQNFPSPEISARLISQLRDVSVSQAVLDESAKLDLAFGVDSGGLSLQFNIEQLTCDILAPNSQGWTLVYPDTGKVVMGGDVLVIARQYANGLVIGDDAAVLRRDYVILGQLSKVPAKASIQTWKDVGYDVVLAKTKLSDGVSASRASSLRCK